MLFSHGVSIEGRVRDLPMGAFKVVADEKQDIEYRFQIVDNTVLYSMDK
jgi:hypothetical protein